MIDVTEESPDYVHHFGSCPHCMTDPTYMNHGKDHFMTCSEHKVYWYVGSNLFSSWRDETPADWEKNAALLDTFTEVKPRYVVEQQP